MKIRVDQRSAFTSVRWTYCEMVVGTDVQESRVETQSSLGSGERFHAPFHKI